MGRNTVRSHHLIFSQSLTEVWLVTVLTLPPKIQVHHGGESMPRTVFLKAE